MNLPDRVLSGLPDAVKVKIVNNDELNSSDCRVAKSYIDRTIIHPEQICDDVNQTISLVALYMKIGSAVPQRTIDYLKDSGVDSDFLLQAQSYKKITSSIKVNLDTLPQSGGASTLLSFCHINSDHGFRRWNLYAENYGKLIKSVKRWCECEALHLRDDCQYDLYLDKIHIGRIVRNRIFEPNCSTDMMNFILQFFQLPISLPLYFTLAGGDNSVIEPQIFECKVYAELKYNAALILPENNKMKYKMICKNILDVTSRTVNAIRFQDSISCDIDATIYFNQSIVGFLDIDTCEAKITKEGRLILEDYCGVVGDDELSGLKNKSGGKMNVFQRLKFVLFG